MKRLFTVLIIAICSLNVYSQGGIQFSAGLSKATNQDAIVTPESSAHYGYFIGADSRLNDGKMYLIIGGQFHNLSFMPQSEKDYFNSEESMQWFKLRVGLGFELFRLNKSIQLHLKTLGSINILSKYPKELLAPPYNKFNSGTAGLLIGLNLEISNFGIGVEYQKGLVNAVNKVEGTEFDFVSLGLNFRI